MINKDKSKITSHSEEVITLYQSLTKTVILMVVTAFTLVFVAVAWFVANSNVGGASTTISAARQADFALATVGTKEQGVYDSLFGLSDRLASETIGGKKYYIASGNSSFRVSSSKNLNNYLENADLRPGNRGTFDLYVICRTSNRKMMLRPVFSAWNEKTDSSGNTTYQDAFSTEVEEIRTAAEFLKGHILFFANMDEKGMYSGNIDLTKDITVTFPETPTETKKPKVSQGNREFSWGEYVYSNENTTVYRMSVYWVWPEQFGNFIYTGNSYNKNLFVSKECPDYSNFIFTMEDVAGYKNFFLIEKPTTTTRPSISTITSPTDFNEATKNYELYSGWYNAADEKIGEFISYIELGFEIAEGKS